MSAVEVLRFWSHVDRSGDCWLWTAGSRDGNYGSFHLNGARVLAHRYAYELEHGPIPDGLVLDHLCRVTMCVRPSHLEPVSAAENTRRGASAFVLTGLCLAGKHDISRPGAVYVQPSGGQRSCRECKKERLARPLPCPECGVVMRSNSLYGHRRLKHGVIHESGVSRARR